MLLLVLLSFVAPLNVSQSRISLVYPTRNRPPGWLGFNVCRRGHLISQSHEPRILFFFIQLLCVRFEGLLLIWGEALGCGFQSDSTHHHQDTSIESHPLENDGSGSLGGLV